jgi:hypothetical protein
MHTDIDHYRIVSQSLTGLRPADEQTFNSINFLADRLQAVRKAHPSLAGVEFSPQVQALVEQESLLAIS